jgi:hypothetical protein
LARAGHKGDLTGQIQRIRADHRSPPAR